MLKATSVTMCCNGVTYCPTAFSFTLILIYFYCRYKCFCKSFYTAYINIAKSRDSSVGIALGYGLDDWGSKVRFPAGAGNFSFHHRVQNGSGAHPASYPVGTKRSFPGGKAVGS
jgi:hypothetical protein